jgi:serine/threonine-protein kinase RsbW
MRDRPAPSREFNRVYGSGGGAATSLRVALAAWLRELRWPGEEAGDVLLAAHEAVSNAVDHAYPAAAPGAVSVRACQVTGSRTGTRYINLEVSDQGRWRPPPADPGDRGWGLMLMRSCAAKVTITPTPRGTRVIMLSHPVPQPDAAVLEGATAAVPEVPLPRRAAGHLDAADR